MFRAFEEANVTGVRVGSWGNCAINTWQAGADWSQLRELETSIRDLYTRYPSGVALIVLIEPGAPLPTAEHRKELESFYLRVTPILRAVAQVVEGTGMWAVAGRSVMAALRLVQRRPYPTRVFSEINEALGWLEPHLENPGGAGVQDSQQGLCAMVDSLRGQPERMAL
jgi:hypothetical protein